MAFGKKKSQDEAQPAEPMMSEPAPDAEDGDPIDSELFAPPDGSPAEPPVDEAPVQAAAAPPSEAATAPAAAADPLGGQDLLSMFQTTTVEADDRAALLELAGEVEIDDLLEDLQTVAAAMGIGS